MEKLKEEGEPYTFQIFFVCLHFSLIKIEIATEIAGLQKIYDPAKTEA